MKPKYIIIHSMSRVISYEGNDFTAKGFLSSIGLDVHGFVYQNGTFEDWIDTDLIARHAGVSEWLTDTGLNNNSIGYEILIEGTNNYAGWKKAIAKPESFKDAMYVSLAKRLASDCKKIHIPIHNILCHSDISGDDVRGKVKGKIDPGKGFDYIRLINMVRAEML